MDLMVRVFDADENGIDYFVGLASDCPPIPRVGEYVDMSHIKGVVKRVDHIHRELSKPLMRVAIFLMDLPAGEKSYSETYTV